MTEIYLDPQDDIERRNEKLTKIVSSLMRRVEQAMDDSGEAYQHFQRSLMLEEQVRERTLALEDAVDIAERANASKSRFVAAVSHDLLQPLSAAKLFLASVHGMEIGEEASRIIQRSQNALNSVESILSSLLDISKLDSGRAAVSVSAFPISQVLDGLFDELEPMARQKGLELHKVPCSLSVESDPAFLRRIIQNLIVNAIRYTDAGKVLVGARRNGRSLRIEVWDTGVGIAPEDQELIFNEFQRLPKTKANCDGVGLGLAIVERACALLGHPIGMTSIEGKGTGFSITVPISRSSGDSHQLSLDLLPDAESRFDLSAIVIENDTRLRSAISSTLEGWGVTVFDAGGYAETRDILPALDEAPDFILADYQLDETETGLDTVALIRNHFPDTPALLVTAEQDVDLPELCRRQGVDLMHKPIEPDTLKTHLFELACGGMKNP